MKGKLLPILAIACVVFGVGWWIVPKIGKLFHREPLVATVLKVGEPDRDSRFYVLKEKHTLVELSDGRRVILLGDLGNPGESFTIKKIPGRSIEQ